MYPNNKNRQLKICDSFNYRSDDEEDNPLAHHYRTYLDDLKLVG